MENLLTNTELKRRGVAAIEDGLKRGPVHILKHNRPAAVVLSPEDYARLSRLRSATVPGLSALHWLLEHDAQGQQDKSALDARLRDERNW